MRIMEPYASLYFLRICTVSLGFVILVIGLNSHYRSSWVSLHVRDEEADKATKMHDLCHVKYFYGNCPDIILEQFFVAVISVNFIFLLLGLLAFCLWYRDHIQAHPLKWLDLLFHGASSLFLLAASVVYIVSAIKIREFSNGVEYPRVNFRTEEKFAAGGLTICQAILQLGIAVLVGKCKQQQVQSVRENYSVSMTISHGIDNLGMTSSE